MVQERAPRLLARRGAPRHQPRRNQRRRRGDGLGPRQLLALRVGGREEGGGGRREGRGPLGDADGPQALRPQALPVRHPPRADRQDLQEVRVASTFFSELRFSFAILCLRIILFPLSKLENV